MASDNSWLSGALGGLAGVVSTIATNRANVQMNRETNAARQQLAEWQNQQNIAQWQRENAYNLPINQMKRLREAGLNPSIMMTEGGVVNEAAQSPQMGSAAGSLTTPQIQSPLDPLTASQVALNMSQANKNNTDAEDTEATRKLRLQVLANNIERGNAEIKDIVSKIEQRVHQNALTDAEKDNISFEQMFKKGQLALDAQRVANETGLTKKQIEDLDADVKKKLAEAKISQRQYDEMVWTFAIRKAGLEKEVALKDAQITQAYATAYAMFAQGEKSESDKRRVDQLVNLDSLNETWITEDSSAMSVIEHFLLSVRFIIDNTAGVIFR